jgi:NAD(P)-dependent dehydrogenase (short-subunit alcohol dehydrogenase family)
MEIALKLEQKHVVVFGGSSGIGFETARHAFNEGARITLVSRSEEKLEAAAGLIGSAVRTVVANVAVEADVVAAFDAIGDIDHLVFTSGDTVHQQLADSFSSADIEGNFSVRLYGAMLVAKHARARITSGGSISLTSSTLPMNPAPGYSLGAAVSSAIMAYGRALAAEFAPIRVNVVAPGVIRSPIWERVPEQARESLFTEIGKRLPVGRVGVPEDVAVAFVYLMKADFTTGQILTVDGGRSVS